jgi:Predicted dehydrogenases and related proteins
MVTKVGVIGLSPGNGHPFSFSAIINGYDDAGLAASGWPVIYDYVRRRDPSEFGIAGLQVTHAWTQDEIVTRRLCRACRIPHAVSRREAMLGNVDAVIIARDDAETHLEMAQPFLEAGLPVFIDKPLSLDLDALRFFRPYLDQGQLMSCSGMRYARELDEARASSRGVWAIVAAEGRYRSILGEVCGSPHRCPVRCDIGTTGLRDRARRAARRAGGRHGRWLAAATRRAGRSATDVSSRFLGRATHIEPRNHR